MGNGLTSTNFQFISWQGVIDDVHVINPTTVLNVRYGYNRFERNSGQEQEYQNFDLTTLGFPAQYNTLIPEVNRYFPRLDFEGNTMVDVAFGNDFRPTTSHTFVATLNKVLAKHSLKGGMEMRIYREDSLSTANAQAGQYSFTNAYTRQIERRAARTTRDCRTTPRSCSGCPTPRRCCAPRTTPSTPRPGASSCRTTGASAAS